MIGVHPWDPSEKTRTIHLVFTPKHRDITFMKTEDAESILQILGAVSKRHDITLHEAAAMPDHVHLLVSFDRKRVLETDVVKKLKGASAREFLKRFKGAYATLWGEKKHFEEISDLKQFQATVQYIQANPENGKIDPEGRVISHVRAKFLQAGSGNKLPGN